jgi:hypothetical protein
MIMYHKVYFRFEVKVTQLRLPKQRNRNVGPGCVPIEGRQTTYEGDIVVEVGLEEVECRVVDGYCAGYSRAGRGLAEG